MKTDLLIYRRKEIEFQRVFPNAELIGRPSDGKYSAFQIDTADLQQTIDMATKLDIDILIKVNHGL